MQDHLKKLKPYLPYIIAFIAGAVMPFGFAPYYVGFASIASVVGILWCIANRSWKTGFVLGFCYGLGMFGFGVYWVYASIHDFGSAAPPLAAAITGVMIALLALYSATQMALVNYLFPRPTVARNLLAFPAIWVIFEIFRGWFLTGFPWLYVGYSQITNQLKVFAPVGGVFLVSFAAVMVSAILYMIIDYYYERRESKMLRNGLILAMFAIWSAAFSLNKHQYTVASGQEINVALVQGNIPQLMRWDPQAVSGIIQTYVRLTKDVLNHDLIIWPEGSIPLPLPLSNGVFREMDGILKANSAGLIAGVPSQLPNGVQYFNALIGLGDASGVFYKEHLVPFGEYVPLENYLRGAIAFFNLPMSSFIEGPADQGDLQFRDLRFAPAICYEIAYPFYVQSIAKDANFILTVSNDTWFGRTIGPAQHLQIAQFRALETGKTVIRATNSGYTAIIDQNGDLTSVATPFQETVLTGKARVMIGQTPWIAYGIWPLLSLLGLSLALAFGLDWIKKGRGKKR